MKKFFKQRIMIRIVGCSLMMFGSMLSMNNTFAATSLTLTSSGSQSIDVLPATGTAISSDAINVTTTCRYGYNFTVQTSVDDTTLYLNGDIDSPAYTVFSPAGGFDPLNETENEWGYFYDGNTVPTNTSIFSPVPSSLEEPAIIKAPLDSPASSDINDNFNIYYGVSASANAEKGTYKMIPDEHDNDGTIVYTATAADACSKYTVHFDPTSTSSGAAITGNGTMDDQPILENVTTPLTNNSFTAPSGYYFAGWNTAQDGSGTQYTNGQQVTDITSVGNTITLYAMWTDCPPNRICYSPNVSNPSDVVGEIGNQAITSSATSAVLYAPNYKHDDYGFAAWNTNSNGTGTNYGPNQTIEFTAGQYSTSGLKLYAKWIASAGNMQNWSGCSSMDIGDVTARKDTRDNNVYAVSKLADGKCWMIENLRLADKDANNNDIILSSTNTHNPSLPLVNSWWYSSANDSDTKPTSNHLSATTDSTITAWCNTDSSNCYDQSMLSTNNTTFFTSNTSSNYSASSNVYSYGNYYNWYSATGGHGKYGSSYAYGYTAPGDICPSGWHLPKGGDKSQESTNEFWQLIVAGINNGVKPTDYDSSSTPSYSGTPEGEDASSALRAYPNNFIFSGSFWSASINGRNSYGDYWTSSAWSTYFAYDMRLSKSSVSPGTTNGNYKRYARVVRCVAGT